MEIINPWVLYLVLQADSIKAVVEGASTCLSVLAGCLAVVVAFGLLYCTMELTTCSAYREEGLRASRKAWASKWWMPGAAGLLALIASFASAMLPSTKTAAMLVVIPTIANSELVQKEANELYQLAKSGLKDLVDEPAKKTARKHQDAADSARAPEGEGE